MHEGQLRWQRTRGRVGANAPSWLTFEVHRPYLDGGTSELTAIQARGPAVAARLYELRQPFTPRFAMVMPASYRQLLTEESRLAEYRVRHPDELPAELATPQWSRLADAAWAGRDGLDAVDLAGLAQWLVAACLPAAVLRLAPADATPAGCADPLAATVQYCRAMALFQAEGGSERTAAAFRVLVDEPAPTVAHLQAAAAWAGLLARHASDDSAAPEHERLAERLHEQVEPGLPAFDAAIWRARALRRGVRYTERHGDLDEAWRRLRAAAGELATAAPATPEEREIALELRRQLLDRQVEIAVRRGDNDTAAALIADGIELDPYCVKIRMQAAQAAERAGDLDTALAEYLLAARLGPFGTAFALLGASRVAAALGRAEPARVCAERAFRAAPRSARTTQGLLDACAGDPPLATVVELAAAAAGNAAAAGDEYRNNWHYQAYGAYLNLAESHSPCLYARLPLMEYEAATRGERFRIGPQRIMPPAFRTNLVKEAALPDFGVAHPADLPTGLRTPAWQRLCEWVADFADADQLHRYLVGKVLFRLGFRQLVLDLMPRPAELDTPLDFVVRNWLDIVGYAAAAGRGVRPSMRVFELVDHPDCPPHLRLTMSVRAVVFVGRDTRSVEDAVTWRKRATGYLEQVLDSAEYTPFEKAMWHSRFYRGVSFAPFLARDRAQVVADMDLSEELARGVPATGAREEFLKAENLHACIESRSKEAFGLGDLALGLRRTEEFLAIDPYDPKSHIEHGEALAKVGRFREAGDAYLRAARLGPLGTAIAYSMAGECFERAGEPVLAQDCFVQSLRVDPYAISAARGWRRTAPSDELAARYAGELEEWGAARRS